MITIRYGQGPKDVLARVASGRAALGDNSALKQVFDLLINKPVVFVREAHKVEEGGSIDPLVVAGRLTNAKWFAPEWHFGISSVPFVTAPGDELRIYETGEAFTVPVAFYDEAWGEIIPAEPPPLTPEELAQVASEIYDH